MAGPRLQAIFQRQISGDDALLALAQRRFSEAGLGAEYHPNYPEELRDILRFRPSESDRYTVHLPRDIRLLDPTGRDRICAFAAAADARMAGLVVHDQKEVASRFKDYIAAVRQLDARLAFDSEGDGAAVFIEYAAGLEPALFVTLHEAVRDCPRIGACIDIGHMGIFQCGRAFRLEHPDLDVWQCKSHTPELRKYIASVQDACRTALPATLELVTALARLGKPLHFHLHDGHPSSTLSMYGLSDHLSFYEEIPIPFSYRGSHTLPTIFGPLGLQHIVAAARTALADEMLSFTLEIHPPPGRQPLGEYSSLFEHWQDLTNAERMQHWIEVLLRNHRLLQDVVDCT
jgi:hypothetical protein